MEKRTEGAWLIHHTKKLFDVRDTQDFEDIELAGKCGIFLSNLAADENTDLNKDKVDAIAKASSIKKTEIETIKNKLVEAHLIDVVKNGGISVLGITTSTVLSHTANIFDSSNSNNYQKAALELSERISDLPKPEKELKEYISDEYKLTSRDTVDLFSQCEEIGFIDYENLDNDSKFYFNGNLFRKENIQKTIKLWEAIAARYNGNEWVAGYDLLNEPGGALGTEQFEVYDRIYKAVRAIDQDHIIQIQAIWEPTHLPAPTLYGWENVVYQYHFYGWDDINNLEYQKAFINSKIKYVNEDTNYNVPVFVGEFTFFTNMDSWEYGLSVFDEQGWSYTSWTYKVAGANSSWGMYTMPKNDSTNVNINTDDFETVKAKWSNFDFTRNTSIADVLSKHFKIVSSDLIAPVIEGNDAAVMVGVKATVSEILDLFIKDDQDGVIDIAKADITTDFDCSKAGVYTVTVEASDKAGNISEAAFTITVKEETVIDPDVVEKPDSSKSEVSVNKPVKTGDNENIIGDLMILGLSMIAGVILLKRRKEI